MVKAKKLGLIDALNAVQSFHKQVSNEMALLRPDQMEFVGNLMTFKDVDMKFDSYGLSHFGGLALFANNALDKTIQNIQIGQTPPLLVIDFVEKISHAVFALNYGRLIQEPSAADVEMFKQAESKAISWFDLQERAGLLKRIGVLFEEMNHCETPSQGMINSFITRMLSQGAKV